MNKIKVLIIYTKLGKLIRRNKILSSLLIGRKKRCKYPPIGFFLIMPHGHGLVGAVICYFRQ